MPGVTVTMSPLSPASLGGRQTVFGETLGDAVAGTRAILDQAVRDAG